MAEAAKAAVTQRVRLALSRARTAMPSAAGAPRRRRAVPVETSTSTTIVITYGQRLEELRRDVTPRAWSISGSAERAPKT